MSEPKPEDMICPLLKMAYIIKGVEEGEVKCMGDKCAMWSHKSGLRRCGLRNT